MVLTFPKEQNMNTRKSKLDRLNALTFECQKWSVTAPLGPNNTRPTFSREELARYWDKTREIMKLEQELS